MDPLSLAASIAGLIALAGKAAEISQNLYKSVKRRPQLLHRLTVELETFQSVLQELDGVVGHGDVRDAEETAALRRVLAACEDTVGRLEGNLSSLGDMFRASFFARLQSRSRFTAAMDEIADIQEDLVAFKLTLGIALQLRVMKQAKSPQASSNLASLQADINGLSSQIRKCRHQEPLHPVQQYVDLSATILGARDRRIDRPENSPCQRRDTLGIFGSETTLMDDPTAASDVERVRDFGSFEDWLNSFAPSPPPAPVSNPDTAPCLPSSQGVNSMSRNTKARIRVRNLRRTNEQGQEVSSTETETLELGMTEYFCSAITTLRARGYTDVCGFRIGDRLFGPITSASSLMPVYVTDGPSSYSLACLEINRSEPLREFYDNVVRTEDALELSIRGGQLHVRDTHSDKATTITPSRTLRLPEDGTTYNLPASFGPFPLINVEFLRGQLPDAMVRKGGLVIPVYPREAVSLSFTATKYCSGPEDLAVRVLCGSINAVSGRREDKSGPRESPDYITTPTQKRLDGFLSIQEGGCSIVRQFVAMAAGEGYSAEGQITGREDINGIQLIIAPPFVGDGGFFIGETAYSAHHQSPDALGIKVGAHLDMYGSGIVARYSRECKELPDDDALLVQDPSLTWYKGPGRPDPLRWRLLRTHEVLRHFLGHRQQISSLEMEPVTAMSLAFRDESLTPNYGLHTGSHPASLVTRKLSPFMPAEKLYEMAEQGFLSTQPVRGVRITGPRGHIPRQGWYPLHHLCASGDVLTIRLAAMPGLYQSINAEPRGQQMQQMAQRESGWEMGLAGGAMARQDVYLDKDPERWNWSKARMVNIQLINAVAFESFTGVRPPEPPFSFRAYVDAGIPFYHVLPNSEVISPPATATLDSVSEVDLQKGIVAGSSLQGTKPVECVACEEMLANSIIRPCNHVFCDGCVQRKMLSTNGVICAACGTFSTHQIQFAGPMEIPRSQAVQRFARARFISGGNHQSAQTLSSCHIAVVDAKKETEHFVSEIRQIVMTEVMESLSRALSRQLTINGPLIKDGGSSIADEQLHGGLPDDGKTLLQTAAEENKADVVEFLLQHSKPSKSDLLTALSLGACAGHLEVVKTLMAVASDLGAIPEKPGFEGKTILEAAAEAGKDEMVRFLVQGVYKVQGRAAERSALRLAVTRGHAGVVRTLLEGGFDPNTTTWQESKGRSIFAALDTITRPINCSIAASSFFDARYDIPLILAARRNDAEVAKLLIQRAGKQQLLHAAQAAAEHLSCNVLELLLGHVEGVSGAADKEAMPLLHIVAGTQRSDAEAARRTIQPLVDHGADVAESYPYDDFRGPTVKRAKVAMLPIHRSIIQRNSVVFDVLLSAGSDTPELDDGRTCLHLAARHGAADIARVLLDRGSNPNQQINGAEYSTPLEAAFFGGTPEVVKLLLSRGAVIADAGFLTLILEAHARSPSRQWHHAKSFECAALLFPHIMPLLCLVDTSTMTFCVPGYGNGSDELTVASELGIFVVAAFQGSACSLDTALALLAQLSGLSPASVYQNALVEVLFPHGYKSDITAVDPILESLAEDAYRFVMGAFPAEQPLGSYIAGRYQQMGYERP